MNSRNIVELNFPKMALWVVAPPGTIFPGDHRQGEVQFRDD